MNRKLKMGMVGGGQDAFIGAIHRLAANMDGQIELSCGALSINPEIARDSGKCLFLPKDRTYVSWEEMIKTEAALPYGLSFSILRASSSVSVRIIEITGPKISSVATDIWLS